MTARGFTLVELLVATLVMLLVAGAALAIVGPARAAFEAQPAAIESGQRLRAGGAALIGAVRNGGGATGAGDLGAYVPRLRPLTSLDEDSASTFGALQTMAVRQGGGQGRLGSDQAGVAGDLVMSDVGCPAVAAVCGFQSGVVAVVFDGRGHFDVFEVAQALPGSAQIRPAAPLTHAYRAGAWVVEARVERVGLRTQADGSRTLTRVTSSGAQAPMVDGVVAMSVVPWATAPPPIVVAGTAGAGWSSYGLPPLAADDADASAEWPDGEHCMVTRLAGAPATRLTALGDATAVVPITVAQLTDGPWCPGAASTGAFDADLFRLVRIDLRLRVEVQSAVLRGPSGRLFGRAGTGAQALRWVPDREVALTVTAR